MQHSANILANILIFSALSSKVVAQWGDLAACTVAYPTVCLGSSYPRCATVLSDDEGLKTHALNRLLSKLCVIILRRLCVVIYHHNPILSVDRSIEPAPCASFTRTMASYINISLTRTVNCLLTKQKSYWQQPHAGMDMCVSLCLRECIGLKKAERERERMIKRPFNVQPLLGWIPAGLSVGRHLSNALNAVSILGLHYMTEHYKGESNKNKDGSFDFLIYSSFHLFPFYSLLWFSSLPLWSSYATFHSSS